MPKSLEFTQFVVYCYVPWWLACPLPASAPMNDIKLISVLDKYKTHNAQIATSALKALGDHKDMWYLTEELVPLALFDDNKAWIMKSEAK